MLYCFMGMSCTGKSTISGEMERRTGAEVFSGKDYYRLAKNTADAARLFQEKMNAALHGDGTIIYVISETEDLELVPDGAVRVLFTAELPIVKQRFAARMHGVLPPPVEAMLERKALDWKDVPTHLTIDTGCGKPPSELCEEIMDLQPV